MWIDQGIFDWVQTPSGQSGELDVNTEELESSSLKQRDVASNPGVAAITWADDGTTASSEFATYPITFSCYRCKHMFRGHISSAWGELRCELCKKPCFSRTSTASLSSVVDDRQGRLQQVNCADRVNPEVTASSTLCRSNCVCIAINPNMAEKAVNHVTPASLKVRKKVTAAEKCRDLFTGRYTPRALAKRLRLIV